MTSHPSKVLLGELFSQRFDVIGADSDALRSRVFDLRFQVFCEELGFAMAHRNGLESDTYDTSSLHCLVHHRATATTPASDAGCVRLVKPGVRGGGLPFESFGLRYIDRKLLDWRQLDPTSCCEISRLAVVNEYRRPLQVFDTPPTADNMVTIEDRRQRSGRMPLVVLALYQAVIALTLHNQFAWIFMVGEPRLQRHLLTYGIRMRQVSPTFDYFGTRAVFVSERADFQAAIDGWNADKRDLYTTVHTQLLGMPPPANDTSLSSTA